MSDINHKRSFVAGLYPGKGWERKVSKMSDAQVVAIFLREQEKANNSQSKEKNDGSDIPF